MMFRRKKRPKTEGIAEVVPVVLITELSKLKFDPFITCAVDHDYSVLIISGQPSPEQLYIAWRALYTKFLELSGSKEAKKYALDTAKLEDINGKILKVEVTAASLSSLSAAGMHEVCAPLVEDLKNWGYRGSFSEKTLQHDMKKVLLSLQNDRLKLAKLKNEYESKQKNSGGGADQTREGYVRALHAIEQYKKMELNREKLTAEDFAMHLHDLQKYQQIITQKYRYNGK